MLLEACPVDIFRISITEPPLLFVHVYVLRSLSNGCPPLFVFNIGPMFLSQCVIPPRTMGTRRLAVVKNFSFKPLLFIHSPQLPGSNVVHLLWQESQNIGDGPFLISAVLNGQVEGGLRLFACYQFQTMQRVNILDGTALKKRKELSKIRKSKEKTLKDV